MIKNYIKIYKHAKVKIAGEGKRGVGENILQTLQIVTHSVENSSV
jgi:hypothetical protein